MKSIDKIKSIKFETSRGSVDIEVSHLGQIYYEGKLQKVYDISDGYKCCHIYCKDSKENLTIYIHRAVCQAFHPLANNDYENYQVDHIDGNRERNVSSNLRWVSRQQNNSRKRTCLLKSLNHKATSHRDEVVKAVNVLDETDVKYYKNGYCASRGLNCSHVLIYNVLNPDFYQTSAKGYELSWIKRSEVPEGTEIIYIKK